MQETRNPGPGGPTPRRVRTCPKPCLPQYLFGPELQRLLPGFLEVFHLTDVGLGRGREARPVKAQKGEDCPSPWEEPRARATQVHSGPPAEGFPFGSPGRRKEEGHNPGSGEAGTLSEPNTGSRHPSLPASPSPKARTEIGLSGTAQRPAHIPSQAPPRPSPRGQAAPRPPRAAARPRLPRARRDTDVLPSGRTLACRPDAGHLPEPSSRRHPEATQPLNLPGRSLDQDCPTVLLTRCCHQLCTHAQRWLSLAS